MGARRSAMTPDVVVLGNLLVDDVVFADGSSRMGQPGGAVLYAALGARLWNVGTGCVSVRGDDYPADMLDRLQGCGVDLAGVQPLRRSGVQRGSCMRARCGIWFTDWDVRHTRTCRRGRRTFRVSGVWRVRFTWRRCRLPFSARC